MKGYLNNLSLRILDQGNRVEPRLPSLFEPPAFESGPRPLETERRITGFDEEVAATKESPSPPGKPQQPGSDERSSRGPAVSAPQVASNDTSVVPETIRAELADPLFQPEPRAETPESVTMGANLQPRREAGEIATEPEVEDAVPGDNPFPEIEEQIVTGPTDVLPSAARLAPTNFAVSPLRQATPRPSELPEPEPPHNPRTQIAAAKDHAVAPRSETRESKSNETPTTETHAEAEQLIDEPAVPERPEDFHAVRAFVARVNPTPATWRDNRPQHSQSRTRHSFSPVEPEPSINVTIGRIEVRAVQSDSRKTSAPRRSESPVMPLEDYLRKQRRGEK